MKKYEFYRALKEVYNALDDASKTKMVSEIYKIEEESCTVTLLSLACQFRDVGLVESTLSHGADHSQLVDGSRHGEEYTPLQILVWQAGNGGYWRLSEEEQEEINAPTKEIINLLQEAGASLNDFSNISWPAIMIATRGASHFSRNYEIAKYLASKGAFGFEAIDFDGKETPGNIMLEQGSVDLLIKALNETSLAFSSFWLEKEGNFFERAYQRLFVNSKTSEEKQQFDEISRALKELARREFTLDEFKKYTGQVSVSADETEGLEGAAAASACASSAEVGLAGADQPAPADLVE